MWKDTVVPKIMFQPKWYNSDKDLQEGDLVYFQKKDTAKETILAKKSFEAYAKTRGVSIMAYHADNGIFRANKWVEECIKHQQGLTFAGVNAHHEN